MSNWVKGFVIALTISSIGCAMGGCAAGGQRHAEAWPASGTSIEACETAVYYSPDLDPRATLDCARVLDVWH